MGWVRLDDRISENPKLDAVGPVGSWLHVCAIAYCNRHLTDGQFPERIVSRLGAFDWTDPETAVLPELLVQHGLWHSHGHSCGYCPQVGQGHYLIHGYGDFQPSRAEVEAKRERSAENGKKGAAKRWREREERNAQLRGPAIAKAIAPGIAPGLAKAMADPMAPGHTGCNGPNPTQPKGVISKEIPPSAEPEIWETVLAVCGIDSEAVNPSARRAYVKAVSELLEVGATSDEIENRAIRYRALWPNASLTPSALARHWPECADPNAAVLASFARGDAS